MHKSRNVSADESASEYIEQLEKLVEASKIVHSTLDLDELLELILDTALQGVNGDRGTIYLIDREKNRLWSKVLKGEEEVVIELPVGEGIAGHVAETGETLNIADASKDKRFNPDFDKKTGYKTRTILCMPLRNRDGKMIGVFQLLNKKKGTFTSQDESFIEDLSIHAASAIENARLYEQERQKIAMEKEMSAAWEVQKLLFPEKTPQRDNYKIAALNIPARQTSGDLYDFVELDGGRVVTALGDVSGKGLPASILMANLQSVMRDLPYHNASPSYCVSRFNNIIHRSSSSGKFITLFFGVLDPEKNSYSYSNAGHEHPYLFRDDRTDRLSSGGLPLGVMPESPYDEDEVSLNPGDTLLLFTDGISDAINKNDENYSEKRLVERVSELKDQEPKQIIDQVLEEVQNFIGEAPQFDDLTMMIIQRNR